MEVRRTLAGIVVLLAFALPAAAGAQQIEIGAADQNPGILEDAYFRWVGVANARVMAPYDVALTDPAPLDRWLRAAVARLGRGAVVHAAVPTAPRRR